MTPERLAQPDQPLIGHLEELRRRVLFCLGPMLICAAVGVALSDRLLGWIFAPLHPLGLTPCLYHLGDAVMLRIRAGVLAGAVVTAPWTARQLYRFARPGLLGGEARALRRLCLVAGLGFSAGAVAMFAVIGPGLVRWWSAGLTAHTMLSAESFFSMWEAACLGAGLGAALAAAVPFGVRLYRNRRRATE